MRQMLFLISTLLIVVGCSHRLSAEPWLSNRTAQNCAGCHAPGRLNLSLIDRRCTLTCSSCHVSPQGGGIRNQYGKWNQQRWLRTFASYDWLANKRAPAPVSKQPYMTKRLKHPEKIKRRRKKNAKSRKMLKKRKARKAGKKRKKNKVHSAKSKSNKNIRVAKSVPHLAHSRVVSPNQSNYGNDSYNEWELAKNHSQFMARVPVEDPYRVKKRRLIYGGGDFRYIYGSVSGEGVPERFEELSFFMAADIGLRMRPTVSKLSFVVEARFDNGPRNKDVGDVFDSHSFAKSAYALIDDLPFNFFLQGGIFKPLFGNPTANHWELAQRVSGFNQLSTYKAVAIGAAPNVPFFTVSLIDPMKNGNQEKGLAAVIGARFVKYSMSSKVSLWNTETKETKIKRNMHSITIGGMIKRLILNGEFLQVRLEDPGNTINQGQVYTGEAKLRLWRETYAILNYATSNVSPTDLSKGSGTDMGFGFKIFGFPGTELELTSTKRKESTGDIESEWTFNHLQVHIFF